MWWSDNSGRIELNITKREAARGYHSGDCDADILELSQTPRISRQLKELNPEWVKDHLREYGAWDEEELKEHEQNLRRMLWGACADIFDNHITDRDRYD